MCSLMNIFVDLAFYLLVDNITKFFIIRSTPDHRLNILIHECLFLGFLVGFLSVYHHFPYVLMCLLFMHIFGTIITEKRIDRMKSDIQSFVRWSIDLVRTILRQLFNSLLNRLTSRSSRAAPKKIKTIPKEWLYNYHLKPTKDLRLERSPLAQASPRPGIFNLHGTTCSLNALLQSLASLNSFYLPLQRGLNFTRSNYDLIIPTFLNLLAQLRNDHRLFESKHWNRPVDTSLFISKLNAVYSNLLTEDTTTDIVELLQCLIDALNKALSKPSTVYSENVIKQVQNRQLTTVSLACLNKLFVETDTELQKTLTLDNLDSKAAEIIQYVDVTWLLHHIQQGSIIKHIFSGQLLHAHCDEKSAHVRFRTEPFQIMTLAVPRTDTTLERLLFQLTKIGLVEPVQASIEGRNNHPKDSRSIRSTLSPAIRPNNQRFGQLFSPISISPSTPVIPLATHPSQTRLRSQTMIADFPEILCIQLKRFSFDRLSQTSAKLKTLVRIDPERILDLAPMHYSKWLGVTNFSLSVSSRYRLMAVCLHLSKSTSPTNSSDGHYVCLYRSEHSRWFLSDDERNTEIHQIADVFQTPYVTENCYLLFFERCG